MGLTTWYTNWIWKREKAAKNNKIDTYNSTRKRIIERRKEIMRMINETNDPQEKRQLVNLLNLTDEKLRQLPTLPRFE